MSIQDIARLAIRIPAQELKAFKVFCDSESKKHKRKICPSAVMRGFIRSLIPEGDRVKDRSGPKPLSMAIIETIRQTPIDEMFPFRQDLTVSELMAATEERKPKVASIRCKRRK